MPARPLLILLTAVIAGGAQAAAEPPLQRIASVVVPLGDLDARRPQDVDAMLQRLYAAAWRACGGDARRHPAYDIQPRYVRKVFADCRAEAVVRGVADARRPAVTAAHDELRLAD